MIVKEKYIRPAYEAEKVKERICDLCGFTSKNEDDWNNDSYGSYKDFEETTIEYASGWRSPEGGNKESIIFDICPSCFKNKLKPWLESHGAKSRVEDIDW